MSEHSERARRTSPVDEVAAMVRTTVFGHDVLVRNLSASTLDVPEHGPSIPLFALIGPGGVGKSTVVESIAKAILPNAKHDRWVSAELSDENTIYERMKRLRSMGPHVVDVHMLDDRDRRMARLVQVLSRMQSEPGGPLWIFLTVDLRELTWPRNSDDWSFAYGQSPGDKKWLSTIESLLLRHNQGRLMAYRMFSREPGGMLNLAEFSLRSLAERLAERTGMRISFAPEVAPRLVTSDFNGWEIHHGVEHIWTQIVWHHNERFRGTPLADIEVEVSDARGSHRMRREGGEWAEFRPSEV